MRLLTLVPDGVGLRNLVLGPFLRTAAATGRCLVLHAIPDDHTAGYRQLSQPSSSQETAPEWLPLTADPESALRLLLRHTLLYGQMRWADTTSMRLKLQRPITGTWRHRALHETSRALSRLCASPDGLRRLDRAHCRQVATGGAVALYRKLFEDWKPDALLCSHHRPTNVIAPVLAARDLGIPTATLIFSWDNLTSKGRIVAPFDHFLVWSELMRSELLRFYPDVSSDRVHVVGTPQFDPYAGDPLSRKEFFERLGANPERPLICYSGGDSTTCPEDPEHARILLEQVRDGEISSMKGKPQVLVRPAPVDTSGRYESLERDFPDALICQPQWTNAGSDWAVKLPTHEDVEFLRNLVLHTDVGINLASTMTLDFALHDTPVVNVAFDVASPPPFGRPLWDHYYQYEHYRPVVELGAARFARSREDLSSYVNAYLENPALDREERRRLVELEVGVQPGESSKTILKHLEEIAVGSSST